jgi:hypothetical protein
VWTDSRQDVEASAKLSQFFEARQNLQEKAGQMLRRFKAEQRKGQDAKNNATRAMEELKLKKRALAAEQEERQRTDAQLKAMKYFDPFMLGQGLERGGGTQNLKERMDFMERVKAKFPPLSPVHENNWREFKRRFDQLFCRMIGFRGKAYGSWFAKEMGSLIQKRLDGHADALQKWIDYHIEKNPTMFALHVKA